MTKLTKIVAVTLATAMTVVGIGCGGGGGGDSTGGYYFTHEELAEDFVYRLNTDLGYDVELVKTNTEQFDYIVIYDWDFGTYDAYYLGNYNPGENMSNYVSDYDYTFYYDLDYIGSDLYEDPFSGTIFQKGGETPKDMMAVASTKQSDYLKDVASHLVQSFNMPQDTAFRFAKAAIKLQVAGAKGMSEDYYSSVMQSLTGTNLNDWQDAVESKLTTGSSAKINDLVKKTAEKMNMSSADLNDAIEKQFGFGL